jgi:hypothetical protein
VSRCHFAGCRQIFNSATTNLARANHFLTHIDHNDVEKLYCPLEDCNFAFTGLTQQGIVAHLKTHFGSGNDGPNPTSHLCPFEDCVDDMTSWTDQRRIQHMIRHLTQNGSIPPWPSPNCPFENCSRNFTDMSREEMTEHLHTHDTDHRGTSCLLCRQSWLGIDPEEIIEHFVTKHTHLRCQWPSCDHRYAPEAAVDDRRVHLRTHLSDQDIPTPSGIVPQTHLGCQMCSKRLKNNTKSIAKHYTTHIRDMFCTWLGCLHQYAEAATDDDRRAHLQTHMSLDCQWPGCNHIYVQSPTDDDITLHLLTHMPAKGGATRPPPVEPQGPDPPGDNPAAVDRGNNNIPQRLKDANPGMNFYCPSCFMLVSGKNPSACKVRKQSPLSFAREIMNKLTPTSATVAPSAKSKATATGSSRRPAT